MKNTFSNVKSACAFSFTVAVSPQAAVNTAVPINNFLFKWIHLLLYVMLYIRIKFPKSSIFYKNDVILFSISVYEREKIE